MTTLYYPCQWTIEICRNFRFIFFSNMSWIRVSCKMYANIMYASSQSLLCTCLPIFYYFIISTLTQVDTLNIALVAQLNKQLVDIRRNSFYRRIREADSSLLAFRFLPYMYILTGLYVHTVWHTSYKDPSSQFFLLWIFKYLTFIAGEIFFGYYFSYLICVQIAIVLLLRATLIVWH